MIVILFLTGVNTINTNIVINFCQTVCNYYFLPSLLLFKEKKARINKKKMKLFV